MDETLIPTDEIMNPAEFRVVREYLGLTGDAFGVLLGVGAELGSGQISRA